VALYDRNLVLYLGSIRRIAGLLLVGAFIAHVAALIVSLFLFHALVVANAGRDLSWRDILYALGEMGLQGLFVLMVLVQISLACLCLLGGAHVLRTPEYSTSIVPGTISWGTFAAIFSIIVFGGIVGVVGGVMAIASGLILYQSQREAALSSAHLSLLPRLPPQLPPR